MEIAFHHAVRFWTPSPPALCHHQTPVEKRRKAVALQGTGADRRLTDSFVNLLLWIPGQNGISTSVEITLKKDLLNTLVELDAAVKAMPSANPKPDLAPLFTRIDQLAQQLPRDTDPILLHYLQKKSYEKARLFLQGRDLENQVGNCRHV
jgi:hypothetical protein